MSQLFPFVISSVGEIYLLNALLCSLLMLWWGTAEYIPKWVQSAITIAEEFKGIFDSRQRCFTECTEFSGGCSLPADQIQEPCRERDLHSFAAPHLCLTDKTESCMQEGGRVRLWMFLEFLCVLSSLCALTCSSRLLSKLYCINNIMLFFKASLSLCCFVQPFPRLLSTISVCNMSPVKGNTAFPAAASHSSWVTGSCSELMAHQCTI